MRSIKKKKKTETGETMRVRDTEKGDLSAGGTLALEDAVVAGEYGAVDLPLQR